ncbi:hypothetical protein [Corynebacterium sp.]|uniref:hypothetical protein n=1 Tax=Corynebacterium sp. TaxID=1720 RepID=UPI0028ACFB78|nr:hypothetical protein [Corynebacterium sp.]
MALEKFHYETADKKKIVLPKFNKLPFRVLKGFRNVSEEDQIFYLFDEVPDEKTKKIIDELTMDEVIELVDAWNKDSEATSGESSD